MEAVSAFVLAGGRSSRMGVDKSLLRLGDETLLAIALRNARGVDPFPVIVGDAARHADFGTVIADQFQGCGPLGGIHAALSAAKSEWNLMLSVDMPLMTPGFLQWLTHKAIASQHVACVPQWNGRNEPLCALYRRGLLPVIEAALRTGRYKVDRVLREAPTLFVPGAEMIEAGFSEEFFRNVNTPEDYEWVKRRS